MLVVVVYCYLQLMSMVRCCLLFVVVCCLMLSVDCCCCWLFVGCGCLLFVFFSVLFVVDVCFGYAALFVVVVCC